MIARVRPDNVVSQRVAVRAGLVRAERLDDEGFDGLDRIFIANSDSQQSVAASAVRKASTVSRSLTAIRR